MNDWKAQLGGNATGFVLLALGVALTVYGARTGLVKLSEAGAGLIAAAMLSLQTRHATDDPKE
jgi:predicted DNA repair protein MutK